MGSTELVELPGSLGKLYLMFQSGIKGEAEPEGKCSLTI